MIGFKSRNRSEGFLIFTILFIYFINTTATSKENLVKINFYQRKNVPLGHSLFVSGNISHLGNWNPLHSLKLKKLEESNWQGEIRLESACDIEYKYFTADDHMRRILWDEGPNAKLAVSSNSINLFQNNDPDMRLMTFNIRYLNDHDGPNNWDNRKDSVAITMNKYSFDFIGLQEAFLSQARDIQNRLPNYMWYGPGREAGGHGEAAPIFYLHEKWEIEEANTFWLSDTPHVEGSMTYGNNIPRI
jgi:hypothetical protein